MSWVALRLAQLKAIESGDAGMLLWTSLAKSDFGQACELRQMMEHAEVKECSA